MDSVLSRLLTINIVLAFSLVMNGLSILRSKKNEESEQKSSFFQQTILNLVSLVILIYSTLEGSSFDTVYKQILVLSSIFLGLANISIIVFFDVLNTKQGISNVVKFMLSTVPYLVIFGIAASWVHSEGVIYNDMVVKFTDRRFEKLAREVLKIDYKDEITVKDLAGVAEITIFGEDIILDKYTSPNIGWNNDYYTYENERKYDYGNIDLYNLVYFKNLKRLTIANNSLENLNSIQKVDGLEILELVNCNLTDLGFLRKSENLTKLYVHNNSKLSDISTLSGLTNLTVLCIGYTNPKSLLPIQNLTNLTDLWLNNCNIPKEDLISGLKNLDYLNLSDCKFEDADGVLQAITGLAKLEKLYLTNTGLKNIEFIREMKSLNLKELSLSSNQISDIEPILTLKKLETVNLTNNLIGSVSCLDSASTLTTFSMSGNPDISDWQTVKNRQNIKGLPIVDGVTYKRPIGLYFSDNATGIYLNGKKLDNTLTPIENNKWLPLDIILDSFEIKADKNENVWTLTSNTDDSFSIELDVTAKTVKSETETIGFEEYFKFYGVNSYVTIDFVRNILKLEAVEQKIGGKTTAMVCISNKYYAAPRVEFNVSGSQINLNIVAPYGLNWSSCSLYEEVDGSMVNVNIDSQLPLKEGVNTIDITSSKGTIYIWLQDKNYMLMMYNGSARFMQTYNSDAGDSSE